MKVLSYLAMVKEDVLGLFFPQLCVTCGRNLVRGEKVMCTFCEYELPQTNYHRLPDNPVEKYFWGKTEVERATSFLFFHKQGVVQELIHKLKYRDRKDVGIMLGRKYGNYLKETAPFSQADLILPVPLHASRLRKRGYNQSDCFAEGLSDAMNIPWRNDVLKRKVVTETQTKKTRMERWKNVENIFECVKPSLVDGKRIILADDVLTTGATMESCAVAIHKCGEVKINLATIACA